MSSIMEDGSSSEDMPIKPMFESKEGIKLTKNTKGYSWELRIIAIDKLSLEDITRLRELNDKMEEQYGDSHANRL